MSDQRQPDQERIDQASKDLRAALRERAREVPSADIDARILAAAHRAVGSGPQSTSKPRRWFRMIDTPFATAAVVLVSASLLLLMREQGHFDHAALKEYRQESGPATATATVPAASSPVPPAAAPSAPPASETAPALQGKVEGKATLDTSAQDKIEPNIEPGRTDVDAKPTEMESDRRAAATVNAVTPPPPTEITIPEQAKQSANGNEAAPSRTATPSAGDANVVNAFPGAEEQRERGADESALAKRKSAASGTLSSMRKDEATERSSAPEPEATLRDAAQPAMAPAASSAEDAGLSAPASATSPAQSATPAVTRLQSKKELDSTSSALSEQEQLLQSIRNLIKDGKFSDAQLLLRRFKKTFPKEHIPADILAALKPSD